jgi:acyl-CoA hydrolase
MKEKYVNESSVTLTQVMGPGHANVMGNVHGGLLMKLCDEAGGMTATKHAGRPSVTVAVDSMSFHSPVNIGNLVTVKAEVTWIGRTSMETRVTVTAEDVLSGSVTHTNTAYFVYVALGDDSRPVPVPRLALENEQQQLRFERGAARQAHRLKMRQQEVA